jgi:hypothetical protein
MKKKLAIMVITVIMSIGLLACGSETSDLDAVESEQAVPSTEISSEDEMENEDTEETDKETDEQLESENAEIVEEEETTPTWYMDEEGIKNDEFGVVIRKDNFIQMYMDLDYDGIGHRFTCYYYGGDLDSYIGTSYKDNIEKYSIGDMDYAYFTDSFGSTVAFVDDGIIVSDMTFDEVNIDEYFDLITFYDETDADYADSLAYFTYDGLYCPALGICIGKAKDEINDIGIICSAGGGGIVTIYKDGRDAENAQAAVDQYVEGILESSESSAIEETVETNIGKFKYLGRGVKNETLNMEEWLFCSDETTWSVSLTVVEDGESYEDYIGVIENLE